MTEHFDRLWEGAKAIDMDLGVTRQELQDMVYRAVDANGMSTASGGCGRLRWRCRCNCGPNWPCGVKGRHLSAASLLRGKPDSCCNALPVEAARRFCAVQACTSASW